MDNSLQQSSKDSIKKRFIILIVVTAIAVLLLLIRFGYIMLLQGSITGEPPPLYPGTSLRGPIMDRRGNNLAISTRMKTVSAWIPNLTKPEETAKLLSGILDVKYSYLLSEFKKRKNNPGERQFMFIERKIPHSQNIELEKLQAAGKLKGISLTNEFGRTYPHDELASHLLGFVNVDNAGLSGVEYAYDSQLLPEKVYAANRVEKSGHSIYLTIDLTAQYHVDKIADNLLTRHDADSVMILVAEATTGNILAYVSKPGYNPNNFTEYPERIRNFNRPVHSAYEPGSVFKVFTISAMLETGAIAIHDTFYCDGTYSKLMSDGETVTIKCLGVHGTVNPSNILMYSCNAGAAYASDNIEKNAFHGLLRRYGFGERTGIGLSGETNGVLNPPETWSDRTKPTIAFGQEIAVSAVQIIKAATALANNGFVLQPNIISKIVDSSGKTVYKAAPVKLDRILSSNTANSVLGMMQTTTSERGTAKRAAIPGVAVAAKTGTAQIPDKETGKYLEDEFIASCLAIFPADDPQLIVYVVIENPRGDSYFGGVIATPAIPQIGKKLIPYFGIETDEQTLLEHTGQILLDEYKPMEIGDTMPDVKGVFKRQLIRFFALKDIDVQIYGSGKVVHQEPAPGTKLEEGMKIILELE